MTDVQKFGEEFQRVSKDGFDASVRSLGEVNKGFQAIAATVTDYSKKAFEDGTRAFEQLIGAKSLSRRLRSSLSTPRRLLTPTLPRCRSSVRCMSTWRVMPTSRSSKPLLRPGCLIGTSSFPSSRKDPRSALGLFFCLWDLCWKYLLRVMSGRRDHRIRPLRAKSGCGQ